MSSLFIHKSALIALITCSLLCSRSADVAAQNSTPHLVQAAVDGLHNAHHAEQVALVLRAQRGVLMARFDEHTRNMMLHVDESTQLDRATMNALLAPLGVSVRCLRREPVGASPFRHVNADDCSDQAPITR